MLVVCACQRSSNEVTVTVLGEDTSNFSAMENLKGEYEKASNVSLQFYKFGLGVLGPKANQDLANGTGLYDIILQYNFALSPFVRNGWVFTIKDLEIIVPNFAARRVDAVGWGLLHQ